MRAVTVNLLLYIPLVLASSPAGAAEPDGRTLATIAQGRSEDNETRVRPTPRRCSGMSPL